MGVVARGSFWRGELERGRDVSRRQSTGRREKKKRATILSESLMGKKSGLIKIFRCTFLLHLYTGGGSKWWD